MHAIGLRDRLMVLAPSRVSFEEILVDADDPVDYWHRLGQRNAYAQAAGLVIARGNDSLAFTIADWITNALPQGSTEVADLARAAHGRVQLEPAGEAAPALTWMGPAAFQARYRDLPGIDHDFGTGWGAGGDQRISLRQDIGSERSTEAGACHVRSATSAFGEFAARRELRNVRESDKPSHSPANGTF